MESPIGISRSTPSAVFPRGGRVRILSCALEAGPRTKKGVVMKRSLVAVSLAALAVASCVMAPGPADYLFDGMQPAYPEQDHFGRRAYAGWCQKDNARIQPG